MIGRIPEPGERLFEALDEAGLLRDEESSTDWDFGPMWPTLSHRKRCEYADVEHGITRLGPDPAAIRPIADRLDQRAALFADLPDLAADLRRAAAQLREIADGAVGGSS